MVDGESRFGHAENLGLDPMFRLCGGSTLHLRFATTTVAAALAEWRYRPAALRSISFGNTDPSGP